MKKGKYGMIVLEKSDRYEQFPDQFNMNNEAIAAELYKIHDELKRLRDRGIPKQAEIEGGGSTWWYVCPECHGNIDRNDSFCRHCGQAVRDE